MIEPSVWPGSDPDKMILQRVLLQGFWVGQEAV